MVSFTCLLAHLLSSVDNILFVKSSYSGAYFLAASGSSRLFFAAAAKPAATNLLQTTEGGEEP